MKKIIIATILLIAAVGCEKDRYSGFNGTYSYSHYDKERYTIRIADNLIVDNLKALETALIADKYADNNMQAFQTTYKTNGISLKTPGAVWVVDAVETVKGVTITKEAEDGVWTLTRNADMSLNGKTYPTKYTIKATLVKEAMDNHYEWSVTLDGSRKERNGYACTFWSEESLDYTTTYFEGWSECIGAIFVNVSKNDKKVEMWRMQFNGDIHNYSFTVGL